MAADDPCSGTSRYACRLLIKDPGSRWSRRWRLGLGIGLNTTVFTFVNAVLIRVYPSITPTSSSISTAEHLHQDDRSVSFLDFEDWRAQGARVSRA